MYNNVYQEYINNITGTVARNPVEVENDLLISNYTNSAQIAELERLYPDLYRVLYPMIQAACMRNTKPITEETIDEMVKDIYSNFNADDVTVLNINLNNEVRSGTQTNESNNQPSSNTKPSSKTLSETRATEEAEVRNRRPNNYVLNDLIRILLIRELLGRPGNFPPNRPGFPPPRPGGRPPFRPRDIQFNSQDYSIYEEPYMYSNSSYNTFGI